MPDRFVYVTYIRTTPEKLWSALIKPEFTRAYWFGAVHDTTWRKGSPWKMKFADGTVPMSGEILDIDPPKRLVLGWMGELNPEIRAEGTSRCTFEIDAQDDTVKLTVTHEMDCERSKLIENVSNGWPIVLSGLKSLLETGTTLPNAAARSGCAVEAGEAAHV